ncbi:hypothetical protein [Phycicoccus avicenniae]|uniref:hypothetical protein n=1 Tax=Phycicoccus avicenniae TaxID=2828860 RepID=UPI003D2931CC
MSGMKWLLGVLASLVVVVPTVVHVHDGVIATHDLQLAREAAASELAAALPAALSATGSENRRALRDLPPASGTWQEVGCDIDSVDAGLLPYDHVQWCRVRTYAILPDDAAAADGCTSTTTPRREGDIGNTVVLTGTQEALENPEPGDDCLPGTLNGTWAQGTWVVRGARPGPLPAGSRWQVVITETPASQSHLGCDPWDIVLCGDPPGVPYTGAALVG